MQTARHRTRPDAPTPRAPAVPRRIRRHLPRRSLPAVPPALARLPAEVLKLLVFGFLQSISNFVVSLPNKGEKDVKGLLFRK